MPDSSSTASSEVEEATIVDWVDLKSKVVVHLYSHSNYFESLELGPYRPAIFLWINVH